MTDEVNIGKTEEQVENEGVQAQGDEQSQEAEQIGSEDAAMTDETDSQVQPEESDDSEAELQAEEDSVDEAVDAAEQEDVEEAFCDETVNDAEQGNVEETDNSDVESDEAEQPNEESAIDDEEAVSDAVEGEQAGEAEGAEEGEAKEKAPFGVVEDGVEATVESVIEAILFASDEPMTPKRLVSIVEVGGVREIKDSVDALNEKYRQMNCAFRIEEIAGGLQMMTLSNYNHWLKKLIRVRGDTKLTQAALETLAIIAYKQPIIRADVEAIRGVGSGEMIRSLMYKGMVKIAGRAEVLGRPLMYGTTKKFLEVFGLGSLKDLPKIEELKKPE